MRVYLLQASGPHTAGGYQMPLSLPSLGAYLKQQGHEVAAIDLNFPSPRVPGRYLSADMEVVERIRAFRPDVLGISTTTGERHNARFWAGLMKGFIPDLKVVVGGPHVSYTSRQVLERWKAVDYVVRFEGELPFAKLLERLSNSGPLDDVPGLSYRDADGQVHETERAGLISDLDTLPAPDWTVYNDVDEMIMSYAPVVGRDGPWLSGPTVAMMTSRGCPFLCHFCSTSHFWQGRTRFRSPERVIDELKQIKARWPAVRNVIFHDDTITLRRRHIRRICELMLQEGLKFRWKAWSRLDILDKELLELMQQAGCVCLLCGVEAGTEHGLHLVGKKLKLQRLVENTKLIEESGIGCLYSFIAGIPGETREESLATIRLARRLRSPRAIANVYFGTTIFPGTAFCADLEKAYGPIDWEHPAPTVRPLFSDDAFGNPIAPTITHPWEVTAELVATLGLPSVAQLQSSASPGTALRRVDPGRLHNVRQWSPYLLPQLQALATVLSSVVADPPPKVLSIRGRSKESLLSVCLSDCYETLEELALPEEVLQGFPEADYMIDETFGKLPPGGFQLAIDLNSLADLRAVVRRRIISHVRRTLAPDGTAVFLYQNPDHLTMRAGRILGARKSLASLRRPSVERFRAMLKDAGFAIQGQHSAGIVLPAALSYRLPFSLANTLSGFRLPRSLGSWSILVCKPAKAVSTAPRPASSVIEQPKERTVEAEAL